MASNPQTKTVQFGVYKYEHPNFGPLMLLLDVGEDEQKQVKKLKKPSVYRFRDEQPEPKMNIFNRYDSAQMTESIQVQKRRTLSQKPPIPSERKLNKLSVGGASIQKIERRSLEKKLDNNKSMENGILLPSIVKKR